MNTAKEIKPSETSIKINGQHVKFCFNKYQVGRQINFEIKNLYGALDSKIVSKNYKSNFATFTFKKQNAEKWSKLYSDKPIELSNNKSKSKSRNQQPNKPNFADIYQKKDHLKDLKKFNSINKNKARNTRYMTEEEDEDVMNMVPEEQNEGSERSLNVGKREINQMEENINNILNKFDLLDRNKIDEESFLKNEKGIKNNYLKKENEKNNNTQKTKLYQNKNAKETNTYKSRYIQKSQDKKTKRKTHSSNKNSNPSSASGRNKSSNTAKNYYNNEENNKTTNNINNSSRYDNLNNDPFKKKYKNSWLNNDKADSRETNSEYQTPKNISQKAFKDISGNDLMTIDEIMALDNKEKTNNNKKVPKKSRSRNSIDENQKNKYKFGTMTTKEGQINRMMDLEKKYVTEDHHQPKSHVEIEKLKISRKSNDQIDISIDKGNDFPKDSFVGLPSQNNSRPPSEPINENSMRVKKLINVQSDLKRPPSNVFQEPFKPQTQSQLELCTANSTNPKPFIIKKEVPKTTKSTRSRTAFKSTLGRSVNKTDRGLSQNLSNLAANTVVSYDGPNVSVVSLKLREKREEILDTFASLNLDMAWIHRQCKYIDLHTTEGVLKFFELQNRLINKLATKLRKEKNSRFIVEKQCEEMMDKIKSGL